VRITGVRYPHLLFVAADVFLDKAAFLLGLQANELIEGTV